MNDRGEWGWYNEVAARRVIQSVGRAVRSPDDTAGYHILDECFREAVMPRAPGWFTDVVTVDGVSGRVPDEKAPESEDTRPYAGGSLSG